MLKRWFLCLRK